MIDRFSAIKNMSAIPIRVLQSDISDIIIDEILNENIIAVDIETSGLDCRKDKIATCQLYSTSTGVVIVRIEERRPSRIVKLLANKKIRKVFHFAPFDLGFMMYHWDAKPQNIACTKIASKLVNPDSKQDHSLKHLASQYLGVTINKKERLSNWFAEELSEGQIEYAANDVLYLIPLLEKLEDQLSEKGLSNLSNKVFNFIPTIVKLNILGYMDIYSY